MEHLLFNIRRKISMKTCFSTGGDSLTPIVKDGIFLTIYHIAGRKIAGALDTLTARGFHHPWPGLRKINAFNYFSPL